jgi:hypothetical protein
MATLPAGPAPHLRIDAAARLGGSGLWAGEVTNAGTLSPGYSPGVQSYDVFTQEAAGQLLIELAGAGSGQYDQVLVSGVADLDGALNVALLDGFLPKVGDEFRILGYGSVEGSFSSITGLGIGDGMYLEFRQDDTGITLVARQQTDEITLELGDGDQVVRLETFDDLGTTFLSLESASGAMLRTAVQLPRARLIVDGGSGRDRVTLGDLDLEATALEVRAEAIELALDSQVISRADIVLEATAFDAPARGQAAVDLDVSASVLIAGSVVTSGRLLVEARAGADASVVSQSTFALGLDARLDAQARVTETAQITASAFLLRAAAAGAYGAVALPLAGTAPGETLIGVAQTARAMVSAGASLSIGRTSAEAGAPQSLIVEAANEADIRVSLFDGGGELDGDALLDALSTLVVLDKTTVASIGSEGSAVPEVHVGGIGNLSAGSAAVRANSGGTVESVIVSSLSGRHVLDATDITQATVANAQIDTQALSITAAHDTQYLGRARSVSHDVSGAVLAWLRDSDVTGAAVRVEALDQGSYGARAADLGLNLTDLPVGLTLGASLASNVIDRAVVAEIVRSDLEASSVLVQARNEQEISARADAQIVRDSASLATGSTSPSKSLTLGGVLALNQITGGLVAQIVDSRLDVTGSVTVQAQNAAAIDARTQAGSTNTGGSGGAASAAVAFNAIGVKLGGLLAAGVDALLGGGWIGDPDAGILARITGTTLDVGGDLDVQALQSLGVNATVSNLSENTSSASFGASGMSASAVLASNRVQGQARALLEKPTPMV